MSVMGTATNVAESKKQYWRCCGVKHITMSRVEKMFRGGLRACQIMLTVFKIARPLPTLTISSPPRLLHSAPFSPVEMPLPQVFLTGKLAYFLQSIIRNKRRNRRAREKKVEGNGKAIYGRLTGYIYQESPGYFSLSFNHL